LGGLYCSSTKIVIGDGEEDSAWALIAVVEACWAFEALRRLDEAVARRYH